jgi:hypothetical protein
MMGIPSTAIYCIDEPESHMNTRLQGALLDELLAIIPPNAQLWIATHSIGMLKRARSLAKEDSASVTFLEFDGYDFGSQVTLNPSVPNRGLWERVLNVAVADLSELVAPSIVIVCEGSPAGANAGRNADHDARCYEKIFSGVVDDVKFVSGGSSKDIESDRQGFLTVMATLAKGIDVRRVRDRDDLSNHEVLELERKGVRVLGRRALENYLYDDEVLQALCNRYGNPAAFADVKKALEDSLKASVQRGNPADDIRSAAGETYNGIRATLGLRQTGGDARAFERDVLADLLTSEMTVYSELHKCVLG